MWPHSHQHAKHKAYWDVMSIETDTCGIAKIGKKFKLLLYHVSRKDPFVKNRTRANYTWTYFDQLWAIWWILAVVRNNLYKSQCVRIPFSDIAMFRWGSLQLEIHGRPRTRARNSKPLARHDFLDGHTPMTRNVCRRISKVHTWHWTSFGLLHLSLFQSLPHVSDIFGQQ